MMSSGARPARPLIRPNPKSSSFPLPNQEGFTLLELLIALVVMVLITMVLGGVLRLASRAWERGEQQVETQERSRDLVALLSQELRSAYPYAITDGDKLVHFFQGEGGRVRFVSAVSDPSPGGHAPFRVVTLFFERGGGLFIRSAPLLGRGLPEDGHASAHLLDSRVQEFRLRYLGPEGWVSSWEPREVKPAEARSRGLRGGPAAGPATPESDPAIPRAVEVTLTLAPSRALGPITLPIFAATDLKKTNPAGKAGL